MSHTQKIRAYIANELAPDSGIEDVPLDYELITSGLIDSLSLVRLIAWIESEFQFSLGDMNISPSDFNTIEKINQFINRASQLVVA
jgi:acyl carrier protein